MNPNIYLLQTLKTCFFFFNYRKKLPYTKLLERLKNTSIHWNSSTKEKNCKDKKKSTLMNQKADFELYSVLDNNVKNIIEDT